MAEDTELTPLDMSFIDSIPHTYRLLVSGGIAGCVAKTITAPLSRLTILFQVRCRTGFPMSVFVSAWKRAHARAKVSQSE